ncbi:MAG: (2Fe-2S) ferredoxin domain-containing protein [Deltaproteobacteria bacterium]|nr:(2Fe-2S) ferredoxin domain-containing protein [Deltaproteobacteria bacterium]
MRRPAHHLLVCGSFRGAGAKGVCLQKGSHGLVAYLEAEVADRGLDALVSTTGCLKACDRGPVVVVYPHGAWYGGVDEGVADEILDALEEGRASGAHRIGEP